MDWLVALRTKVIYLVFSHVANLCSYNGDMPVTYFALRILLQAWKSCHQR